ncbi:MAG: putative peptide-modifying radical SAM/SPASM domain-containing protein [Thermoproteota archaeon]|nr:MAG: putative peptide-modifying radical SAM/SPASM domain-containing protein [Candidatus Korarchaeota archaeon]
MLYIVLTTGQCNLKCKYCGGSFPKEIVPWEVQYSIEDLVKFLSQDREAIVAFYGGEPLLNPGFIEKVMKKVLAKHFLIQTNGILIENLKPEFWRRMDAVLLSIDGRKEVTDYYRGKGVYDKVLRAAARLRAMGFEGDLIARMAVSERSDVYLDVTHLLKLGLFDHVHWQLDVIWSDSWDDFDSWVKNSYKPGISKLVALWLNEMRKGRVLGIVPFQGVMKAILQGGISSPPCGSGRDAFAISTDGRILACPIAADVKWAYLGDIQQKRPEDLRDSILIEEPCVSCDVFRYCGGRCLYTYKERLWGEGGFRKVCDLTKHMISELLKISHEVRQLMKSRIVRPEQVLYPRFNNTTEIIP